MDRAADKSVTGRGTVLVVDDNDQVREMLQVVMGALGFGVDLAAGGGEALALLDQRHYEAVICDLKMPCLAGDELFRICEQRHPEVARGFIFLSGSFAPATLSHLAAVTGQPYLSKPCRVAELEAALVEVTTMGITAGLGERTA